MKYSDFEKHIGRTLETAQEPVQMGELLAGLGLQSEGEKNRRKYFYLWFLVPFILVGLFCFIYLSNTESTTGNNTLVENNHSSIEGNQEVKILEEKTYKDAHKSDESTNELQSQMLNYQQGITNTKLSALENTNKGINALQEAQNQQSKASNGLKESSVDASNNYISHSQHQEKRPPTPTAPIVTGGGFFSNFSQESQISTENNFGKPLESKGSSNYSITDQMGDEDLSPLNNLSKKINISSLPVSGRELEIASLDIESEGIFSRMKINCPSFAQAEWRLALIPEVGVFRPMKTLASKSGELTPALEERIENETTLEGLNLGLYGMLVRDKVPFYIKAGISYSRFSERMDLTYNYAEQDTTIGVISQTVSANGDTITSIYGEIITEIEYTGSSRQHNYIHLFDMPISVGYSTYIAGFDVGVEAGVKINLMTRATGNMLTTQSEFTNLSLNQLFKSRIDLSYFGGLLVGRNFGRFGDFYLSPRFHYYTGDFSNSVNPVSQKYMSIGVNAGFVYKLK